MQTDKKWLTITETARHISMSVAFVRRAVRNGAIPHTRVGSKCLRFDRSALDAWMAASGNGEIAYRKN